MSSPNVSQPPQVMIKRVLDVTVAAVGLAVSAPLLALIWVWVRLDSPGPAVFGQRRVGRGGREFTCLKFRTMCPDAEARLSRDPALQRSYRENGFKVPMTEDYRITRAGRFLRRSGFDELPQLVNVLRGEMSLVGPRPLVPDEIDFIGGASAEMLTVRPGITGAWVVGGAPPYPERVEVEVEYVRTASLLRDLAILARTLPAVFRRHRVHG